MNQFILWGRVILGIIRRPFWKEGLIVSRIHHRRDFLGVCINYLPQCQNLANFEALEQLVLFVDFLEDHPAGAGWSIFWESGVVAPPLTDRELGLSVPSSSLQFQLHNTSQVQNFSYLSGVKCVAVFMAIWVLFLSLLPCSDVEDHTHFTVTHAQHAAQLLPDCHSESGMEIENCAPFCHCNCCQSSTTIHAIILLLPPNVQSVAWYPILHDQFEARHPSSVWHPPIA
jgi:hypothetical protein